jgi:thiol-disulfide isomerase/thioredoxin
MNLILVIIGVVLLFGMMYMCKSKSMFQQNEMVSTPVTEKTDSINNNSVLVFYAPWCGYCKKSMSEFKKAAQAESGIMLINADLDENKSLAKKYNVKGFPTIVRGDGTVYTGDRNSNSIIDFYNNK